MPHILVPLASIALSHVFRDPLVEIWPVKVPPDNVDGLMLAKVSRYFRVMRRARNKQSEAVVVRYPNSSSKAHHAVFERIVFVARLAIFERSLDAAPFHVLLTCVNHPLDESLVQMRNLQRGQVFSVEQQHFICRFAQRTNILTRLQELNNWLTLTPSFKPRIRSA